jgi:hypothetical protein
MTSCRFILMRQAVRRLVVRIGNLAVFAVLIASGHLATAAELFLRANQVGYRPQDPKLAIAFSEASLPAAFQLVSAESQRVVFEGKTKSVTPGRDRSPNGPSSTAGTWGRFPYHAELDFSSFKRPGTYCLRLGGAQSWPFEVGTGALTGMADFLLEFMRQQRCGTNPWLGALCHQLDGRTAFGPLPPGTPLDARGGWHDAGDQLKYLLTSGNATAQMLLAFQLGFQNQQRNPGRDVSPKRPLVGTRKSQWSGTDRSANGPWLDVVDSNGSPGSNGIPDILDEARWGLEWMLKLRPAPDQLYHQVADDRDHIGLRLPQNEVADYGWGKGGARVVYFADGKPQGLSEYKSKSTGIASLAGRYAAAMALAYQVWGKHPEQREFAERCLQAGKEVYDLGRAQEGVQQGNSYRAPYRYEETTWADDMEWGAAELFRATRERQYLDYAKRYAVLAGSESWMGREQTAHYEFYPFLNAGHFRLYGLVDRAFKKKLASYYREGIERCVREGQKNPYRIGVPFIWCSNNLVVALATQCLFYERMTGDSRYGDFAAAQRDWLLGRNPWGFSMFTGVGSVSPTAPHLPTWVLLSRPVRGGLVDGPVYERIFKSLKGVSITEPDPVAAFQGQAVYHDDFHDYASNEPTMDGTASAILLWALCAEEKL